MARARRYLEEHQLTKTLQPQQQHEWHLMYIEKGDDHADYELEYIRAVMTVYDYERETWARRHAEARVAAGRTINHLVDGGLRVGYALKELGVSRSTMDKWRAEAKTAGPRWKQRSAEAAGR